jgi:hypothetical protein
MFAHPPEAPFSKPKQMPDVSGLDLNSYFLDHPRSICVSWMRVFDSSRKVSCHGTAEGIKNRLGRDFIDPDP